MARVDAEAALDELAGWVADTKTGYGRAELLCKVAQLRQRHRVSEDLLDRVIRLYGGPVALLRHLAQLVETTEALPAAAGEDELDGDKASDPRPFDDRGGHDGRRRHEDRAARLAGAARS